MTTGGVNQKIFLHSNEELKKWRNFASKAERKKQESTYESSET
jgi:hypothetical protein